MIRFIPTHVGNTPCAPPRNCHTPVHPHACGEHYELQANKYYYRGSSPRMWGTLSLNASLQAKGRFIPTHVGNTPDRSPAAGVEPVHPHACGEHVSRPSSMRSGYGSSPRMWGTLHELETDQTLPRFIPTHVGNTLDYLRKKLAISVHPHACGEHCFCGRLTGSGNGSSPRMWGTPIIRGWLDEAGRFIPTHVGNTGSIHTISGSMTVHPHACGEH